MANSCIAMPQNCPVTQIEHEESIFPGEQGRWESFAKHGIMMSRTLARENSSLSRPPAACLRNSSSANVCMYIFLYGTLVTCVLLLNMYFP